ncbi:hypothetical protein HBI56_200800 [Parastagonospora nodorum]|uniref:Uncharacterized protein n=1 Tax=Phaeosphaeria nodorum (strain SN15 / ATCC MYA-4574 / FGSC 10173) TaxID=321614 RepID=A0A7U2HXC4_PHANO|nr:hypothetical protein HBH56_215350 [Parastagonospora nodorum]QRC93839.1 hypothetical protein JI435_404610 [Parastagonospora nodorum SN15]KAH3922529.1 hypothetical protein HBH54_222150 [Parastagonospora nodorum]KAH3942106.1 hypothetical protein HBH53_192060 [Parastagonospora nodorum]KAH3961381.1 hypothetical protein HBH51_184030 [Parastagonospora nodorum]
MVAGRVTAVKNAATVSFVSRCRAQAPSLRHPNTPSDSEQAGAGCAERLRVSIVTRHRASAHIFLCRPLVCSCYCPFDFVPYPRPMSFAALL